MHNLLDGLATNEDNSKRPIRKANEQNGANARVSIVPQIT